MSLLLIRADLVNPPSVALSFRDITLYSTIQFNCDVCLEVEDDTKDIYYHWMKPKGLLDFVKDIVEFGEETGYRIDCKKRTYNTLVVDRIVPENSWMILNWIKATR